MAKKKRPVNFEIPRDEEGHFLPKEMWTKKEIREYDRLKKEGVLKNPMKKTKVAGSKRAKNLYIQPQGSKGTFLPKEKWTKEELQIAKKAQKKGQTIAAQLPRDEKGRFVSPTGKKPKKKKGHLVPSVEYPMVQPVVSGDGRGLHQGNVTVVYPPYPPYAPAVTQVPQQPALSKQDIELLIEKVSAEEDAEEGGICSDCEQELMDAVVALQQRNDMLVDELQRRKVIGDFIPQMETIKQSQIEGRAPEQLELPFSRTAMKKNPLDRYPMYYVKRTFGERVSDALGNLGRNPLLAMVAIGAVVAIGYALYRAFKAFRMRMQASAGVDIVNGTIYFPGESPYVITDEDKLWLARSIWGEVNRDPSAWSRSDVQQGGAAVLWAFANHYMTVGQKRNLYPTLGEFVQAYSQPINPRWDSASDSRCVANPAMCTPDRLAFRQELRNTPWTSFPPALQNLVLNFAAGQVQNPVGTRTDFRAAGTGYVPADPINVAGNIFGTADNARRRPVQQVA